MLLWCINKRRQRRTELATKATKEKKLPATVTIHLEVDVENISFFLGEWGSLREHLIESANMTKATMSLPKVEEIELETF